jgi:hypothetical protein
MYIATLHCGVELSYEARSFLPAIGDRVPCRRHGYCRVSSTQRRAVAGAGRQLPRARPRVKQELLEYLRTRPMTTVHGLLRQRFTLRLIASAERDGLVAVDLEAGRVYMRSPSQGTALGSRI